MTDPGKTAYEARFAGEDREDRELLAALEQSLGVQGIAAVFRKSLAMAAEVAASVNTNEDSPSAPSEADFLRETIKVVEWQRDNARQERNEERARASAAEAEVAKLTRERDEARANADTQEGAALDAEHFAERAIAAESIVSALRDRVAVLEEANARLLIAFHDATRRPLGVTPDSGAEFYDQRMADEAEKRRAGGYAQDIITRVGRAEAIARAAALADAQERARTALTPGAENAKS